uniref:helix-turn-helix domain-containing protein n=1 Tax=Streptomyces pharetrae TaxID=291370 RepID=UPI00296EF74F
MERFEGGEKNREIAAALRVSERSLERWRRAWRERGEAGILSKGSPGRPRSLGSDLRGRSGSWSVERSSTAGPISGERWHESMSRSSCRVTQRTSQAGARDLSRSPARSRRSAAWTALTCGDPAPTRRHGCGPATWCPGRPDRWRAGCHMPHGDAGSHRAGRGAQVPVTGSGLAGIR